MIPDNLHDYYKLHAPLYDLSRWAFLFGRNSASKFFPELPEQPNILDFGCGTGLQLQALSTKYPHANIIGIDQSPDMLNIAHKKTPNVTLKNEQYTLTSFSENNFDLIVASYSLSMVNDLAGILLAFKYHLKPDGRLFVVDFDATPFHWFNRWMKTNHVHFDDRLFVTLQLHFETEQILTQKGYLGLYTYSTFLGKFFG